MKHYVLIKSYAVYVKEGEFFEEQGGLVEDWGKEWEPIMAKDLKDAYEKAKKIACKRFPHEWQRSGSVAQYGRIHKI